MKVLAHSFLLLAIALGSASAVTLPGKTLKGDRNGKGPKLNPKVAFGEPATPTCPYIGLSYNELLIIARANYPAIYRQALKLRQGGFTKPETRQYLEDELCAAWEASLP